MNKTAVAIAGIIAVATIAALAIIVGGLGDKIKDLTVDVTKGTITVSTYQIDTNIGTVPVVQDARAKNTVYSSDAIEGSTIISNTYGFTISAPNTRDWILIDDQQYLESVYDYMLYPGANLLAGIEQQQPDENNYFSTAYVFVERLNGLTAEQNMIAVEDLVYAFEEEGWKVSDVSEYVDPEFEVAVLTYRLYGCDELEDGSLDCYESLHVETFFKTENDILYNVRGQVNPYSGDEKAPETISDDLFDIMNSFTLI